MPRGQDTQSPTSIARHLKGIDFPADKDQLIEMAEKNGADDDVLDVMSEMPDDEYENMADVMKAYGQANVEDDDVTADD